MAWCTPPHLVVQLAHLPHQYWMEMEKYYLLRWKEKANVANAFYQVHMQSLVVPTIHHMPYHHIHPHHIPHEYYETTLYLLTCPMGVLAQELKTFWASHVRRDIQLKGLVGR